MKPPNKGKRAIQKRVVSLPIGEFNKGEGTPPKDSWSWRKYGQKPIKGSPYPRGYYRCSSSKGCPARKQVERSKANPSTLMITYAYEHNHNLPLPATSKYSNSPATSPFNEEMAADTTTNTSDLVDDTTNKLEQEETEVYKTHQNLATDESILMSMDYFGWFSDVVSTSERILESPISAGISIGTNSINKEKAGLGKLAFPSMREEDELLFADLGELPECSVVYQGGLYEREEEQGQCSLRAAS